jgi:hypothetical protein
MTERPILFSAAMVRALLAGTKTQTRRAMKPQPEPDCCSGVLSSWALDANGERAGFAAWFLDDVGQHDGAVMSPYGGPGDRLYVRESFSGPRHQERHPPREWHSTDPIHYWADGNPAHGDLTKPRPGIHMPRWASRITLEITEVRVERLQQISEQDATEEGAPGGHGAIPGYGYSATPLEHYRWLWESINGIGSWDANQFVWAISVKRTTP